MTDFGNLQFFSRASTPPHHRDWSALDVAFESEFFARGEGRETGCELAVVGGLYPALSPWLGMAGGGQDRRVSDQLDLLNLAMEFPELGTCTDEVTRQEVRLLREDASARSRLVQRPHPDLAGTSPEFATEVDAALEWAWRAFKPTVLHMGGAAIRTPAIIDLDTETSGSVLLAFGHVQYSRISGTLTMLPVGPRVHELPILEALVATLHELFMASEGNMRSGMQYPFDDAPKVTIPKGFVNAWRRRPGFDEKGFATLLEDFPRLEVR